MSLRLFNTLTRRVEPLEPLAPPRVTFYACGPTVWNHAHIGNFRTFVLVDVLRRYLRYSGYDVFHIMNLTDVDDRLIKAAREAGRSIKDHTKRFVDAFFEDRDYLRIEPADAYPRATEYIGPMIELVQRLLDRGIAYKADDGSVYFAVGRFAPYGRLSQLDRRELKAGARVATDEYSKEDVRDFAVWKAAQPEDEEVGAVWDAPFGRGRPGWHLECSAMALGEVSRRFGVQTLDLHAGGVDLIFPHHENEIAQSEGATHVPFVRHWIHGEFLMVHGTKMSKRFGNILTVRDLWEEGVDAGTFRRLLSATHYRRQLDFTDKDLQSAAEASRRLGDFRSRLVEMARKADRDARRWTDALRAGEDTGAAGAAAMASQMDKEFRAAMDDDLNVPEAVAAVFEFVRAANREIDAGRWGPAEAATGLRAFDRIMDVVDLLPSSKATDEELTAWVERKIAERWEARRTRDFAAADAIRDELAARGVELEDTPDGTRWKVRVG